MPVISVQIENKIAVAEKDAVIVCGNTDYTIAFSFDEEWLGAELKTARFCFVSDKKTKSIDVPFSGTDVVVPKLFDTQMVLVGVFSGDLRTTTGAKIACKQSIRCGKGELVNPFPSEKYDELTEAVNEAFVEVKHDVASATDMAEKATEMAQNAANECEGVLTQVEELAGTTAEIEGNVDARIGEIEVALDNIIQIQENLMIPDGDEVAY